MIKLNGKPINTTLFPDNTSQVWKLHEESLKFSNFARITWEFSHEGEFMHLAQLKSLLERYNIEADLHIKYLPYARQDKLIENDATFALRTFAKLLNSLKFKRVTCLDPHSREAELLIANFQPVFPTGIVNEIFELTKSDAVCFPDKGAKLKYTPLFPNLDNMYGEKDRNQLTGWIEGYKLIGDPQDKSVLIVDDICDGGMTFILLAKQLLEAGAKEVNLYVTHGIFSKGLRCLRDSGINKIFTADGECSEVQNNIAYRRI